MEKDYSKRVGNLSKHLSCRLLSIPPAYPEDIEYCGRYADIDPLKSQNKGEAMGHPYASAGGMASRLAGRASSDRYGLKGLRSGMMLCSSLVVACMVSGKCAL